MSEYESYLLKERNQFLNDPSRSRATLDAVGELMVERTLDIGCGAGQELLPLLQRGAFGVGIDLAVELDGPLWLAPYGRAAFARCFAEALPFKSECFDVIICRVALPYMDNRVALGEMARVLRPGGLLLLKSHAALYYVQKFRKGLRNRDPLCSMHAVRVLVAGALYHLLGFQFRRLISSETFQSTWMLKRELRRLGMGIRGHLPDTNPLTPSFVIEKADPGAGTSRRPSTASTVATKS